MTPAERQKTEIETMRPRSFTLKLSDEDIQRLYEMTYQNGTTPAELLEGFIMDLVGGTYTHGSDEREYANLYFDRCCYPLMMRETFLTWALRNGRLDEYTNAAECLQDMETDLQEAVEDANRQAPGVENETADYLMKETIADLQETVKDAERDIAEIYADYKADMERQQQEAQELADAKTTIAAYIDELESMKNQ